MATSSGATVGTKRVPLVPAMSSVAVKDGMTQVNATPRPACSTRAVSVSDTMAALLAA